MISKLNEINYDVDLGPSFNMNATDKCYCIYNDITKERIISPIELSNYNECIGISNFNRHSFTINVGHYPVIQQDTPLLNENNEPVEYYLNEEERKNNKKRIRYPYKVNLNNPIIASKLINGGRSNYQILMDNCQASGHFETIENCNQHVLSIQNYLGEIPVVTSLEEQKHIKIKLINMHKNNPIENRLEKRTMILKSSEILFYIIKKLDNELLVHSIISAYFILVNHNTVSNTIALQNMYELMDKGIPEGLIVEKIHDDINNPQVILEIENIVNKTISKINDIIDFNKYHKIDIDNTKINHTLTNSIDKIQSSLNIFQSKKDKNIIKKDTKEKEVPIDFKCSITMDVMSDPVICSDGHSYERKAIEKWLVNHNTSPKTNAILKNRDLIPNHSLRSHIENYLQTY